MTAADRVVRLEGVGKTFATGTVALEALDLEVRPGEFLTLLGPSGCGKSTVLRLIAGLAQPSSGSIHWPARSPGNRLRLPGADADALDQRVQQCLAAAAAARHEQGRCRREDRSGAGARRAVLVRASFPARIVGRHEDARLDRPRSGAAPAASPDGRALRGARRDHPFQAQQRSPAAEERARDDDRLRHPFRL